MKIRLKPLRDQTMVITGATSAVGASLARKAARRGARLVLAAPDDDALRDLTGELERHGAQAVAVSADLSDLADLRRIVDAALERFGSFDSWVNIPVASLGGAPAEASLADQRRLFDSSYWSVVHGSLAAAPHLKLHGGALVNIGGVPGTRAGPALATVSASRQAVKGFTHALRMELEQEKVPVSVTLITPSTVDAPRAQDIESSGARSAYLADLVAETVLHACQHPLRDLNVGPGGGRIALLGHLAPRLSGRRVPLAAARRAASGEPRPGAAHEEQSGIAVDAGERDGSPRHAVYAVAAHHPLLAAGAVVGLGLLAWHLLGASPRRTD